MRAEILRRIEHTQRPIVVFDVDSTLLCTAPRHLAILTDFAVEYGHSGLSDLVRTLQPTDFGWTVDGPLPAELRSETLLRALSVFWRERFFSSQYLGSDTPTRGAVAFVREIWAAGALIYYLTARDQSRMDDATRTSLLTLGFPIGRRTILHLKPKTSMLDVDYKRAAIQRVRALGQVVATFENEPANANLFVESFPGATHVLLATCHSPEAPPLSPLVHIWRDFLGQSGLRLSCDS